MTFDYDYAPTLFDIIMISPFYCLLLVLTVHIPGLTSVYISTGHIWVHGALGALYWAYQCIWARIMELGVYKGLPTGATDAEVELQRTRETDQSNIAFASQQG